MGFTIKATYNGETRRWNQDDIFPSYQSLSDQIHKVFRTIDNFYLARVTFTQSTDPASGASLIANIVSSADDWVNVAAAPFIGRSYPNGLLKFVVHDILVHRKAPTRQLHRDNMDIDVDPFAQTIPSIAHAPQPAGAPVTAGASSSSTSQSVASSCCSVKSAKTEIKGMMESFLHDFQRTMADNFSDPNVPGTPMDTSASEQANSTPQQPQRSLSPVGVIPGAFVVPLTTSAEVIHPSVLCDHCGKTVRGTRYKCQKCPDFDICQACMGDDKNGAAIHSAAQDEDHPFSAIERPLPTWTSPISRPEPARSGPTHNAFCDVCRKTIIGSRHKCLDCPDYDMCDSCVETSRHKHNLDHQFLELKEPGRVIIHNVDRPFPGRPISTPNARGIRHYNGSGRFEMDAHPHMRGFHHHRPFPGRPRPHGHRMPHAADPNPLFNPPPFPPPFPPPHMNPFMIPRSVPEPRVAESDERTVHNATCDLCDSKIIGVRHKCIMCPDYDVCTSCYSIVPEQHPRHAFVKIRDPADLLLCSHHYSGRVTHYARCDSCARQIVGARFKCLHPSCPDFDLCENCEALPIDTHPSSHPLLKLKQPISSYEGLQKIFEFARGNRQLPVVEPPSPIPSPAIQTPLAPIIIPYFDAPTRSPVELEEPRTKTPTPDVMAERRSPPVSILPSAVPTIIPVPAPISAPSHLWNDEDSTSGSLVILEGEGEREPSPAPILKPAVMPAGASFVKSWKMVNDGNVAWPLKTQLWFAGGDRMGTSASDELFVGGGTLPGEAVDIRVELKAPSTPGHHTCYWRLMDAEGSPFGHRIWCEIAVSAELTEENVERINSSLSSSSVIMPAPASIASGSVPGSPVHVRAASPSIASLPSEIDADDVISNASRLTEEDLSDSGDSDLWEDASRPASPDQFVMVYESSNDSDEN
ncbi:hypothetical protein FRB99_005812 [Tulasnella sp. 403]|nr:hypothetical protein FRB99_005812 [Tulasnella sp. 403]